MKIERTPTEHPERYEQYDYSYRMSRLEVLMTNALYSAYDAARRRPSIELPRRIINIDDPMLNSDVRVAFSDHIAPRSGRQRQPTSWYIEHTGLSLPRFTATDAPTPSQLRRIYEFGEFRAWDILNHRTIESDDIMSRALLLGGVREDTAMTANLEQDLVGLRPDMVRTILFLGRYIEGPNFRPDDYYTQQLRD